MGTKELLLGQTGPAAVTAGTGRCCARGAGQRRAAEAAEPNAARGQQQHHRSTPRGGWIFCLSIGKRNHGKHHQPFLLEIMKHEKILYVVIPIL